MGSWQVVFIVQSQRSIILLTNHRLIWDCERTPTLIPVMHMGMDSILPNPAGDHESQPCVIRPGHLVTVNIGQPLNMDCILTELRQKRVEAEEAR